MTIFLKLGGSLITDKTRAETVREDVLARLAREIGRARTAVSPLRLVLGHGSGSFGHVAGAKHGTRQGVATAAQWLGFAEVSDAAARLNRRVASALLAEGVAAVSWQPCASAVVADGRIQQMAVGPVRAALAEGVLPLVYGDVAFDTVRGGTIISTEEVMGYLTAELRPTWLLLAGETQGVYDPTGQVIPLITAANFAQIAPALGGSRGTDVTGGMASKVREMLDLTAVYPQLRIRIFSGLEPEAVYHALVSPETAKGTLIRA